MIQEVIAELRLSKQTQQLEQVSPCYIVCLGQLSCLDMWHVSCPPEVPGLDLVNGICHSCVQTHKH